MTPEKEVAFPLSFLLTQIKKSEHREVMREQISSTTSNLPVLVFYFCVILVNHHKFCSLRQHPFTSSQFGSSEIQGQCDWVLYSRAEIKVFLRLSLAGGFWGRTGFQVHAGHCRIQFLAAVGLTFYYLASCQPRATLSGPPSHPKLPAFLAMWFPPSPQPATENHSHLESLSGLVSVFPVSDIQIQV